MSNIPERDKNAHRGERYVGQKYKHGHKLREENSLKFPCTELFPPLQSNRLQASYDFKCAITLNSTLPH